MNIILVTALWCPSCIIMRPLYEKVINNLNLHCKELDFDDDESEVDKLNVGSTLPVCIIYRDDKEVMRIIGEKNLNDLNKIFTEISSI